LDFRTFLKLYDELNEFKPDVVHTHLSGAIYALPWVIFHNVKMIHTVHTVPKLEFPKIVQKILRFFYVIDKAIMVTVSPENKIIASKHYSLEDNKIKMIYNPVDTAKYYKDTNPKADFVFINVGRQDVNKNQELIIKAIAELRKETSDIRLFLIGDGNQHEVLKELSKKLAVEDIVTFTKIIGNVHDYLAIADVYIQSSRYEGLPLSILEAMAARLPIISTDVGGIHDIVTNNGILIPSENLNELVIAMRKLRADTILMKKMSDNSYHNVQAFDSKVMSRKYCVQYDESRN